MTTFLEFFVSLAKDNADEAKVKCKNAEQEIGTLTQNLEENVTIGSSDFREMRKGMELFVNTLEASVNVSVTS